MFERNVCDWSRVAHGHASRDNVTSLDSTTRASDTWFCPLLSQHQRLLNFKPLYIFPKVVFRWERCSSKPASLRSTVHRISPPLRVQPTFGPLCGKINIYGTVSTPSPHQTLISDLFLRRRISLISAARYSRLREIEFWRAQAKPSSRKNGQEAITNR